MPVLSRTFRGWVVGGATFVVLLAAGGGALQYWSGRFPDKPPVAFPMRTAEASTPPTNAYRARPGASPSGASAARVYSDETVPHIAGEPAPMSGLTFNRTGPPVSNPPTAGRPAAGDGVAARIAALNSGDTRWQDVPDDPMARHLTITNVETSTDAAVIMYNLPDTMTMSEERVVTITLARGLNAGQILAAQTLPIAPENVKLIHSADSVRVRLAGGRAFTIVSVREPGQPLSLHSNDTGNWPYYVTAMEGGEKSLILDVTAVGDNADTPLGGIEKKIIVSVPLMTRVWAVLDAGPKELVVALVAGVLSIIVGAWYERRTRRLEPAVPAPADEIEPIASVDEPNEGGQPEGGLRPQSQA